MIRLGVRHNLLYKIVSDSVIKVEIFPEVVGVLSHEVVHSLELVGDETFLNFGIFLGGVPGHAQPVEPLIGDLSLIHIWRNPSNS